MGLWEKREREGWRGWRCGEEGGRGGEEGGVEKREGGVERREVWRRGREGGVERRERLAGMTLYCSQTFILLTTS